MAYFLSGAPKFASLVVEVTKFIVQDTPRAS